jgi:hypothetical protein
LKSTLEKDVEDQWHQKENDEAIRKKMKQKINKTPPLKINKPYKLPLKRIANAKYQMEIVFKKLYKNDYLVFQFGRFSNLKYKILLLKYKSQGSLYSWSYNIVAICPHKLLV